MKTRFLRMCSILLVLALLVNMLPMSILAEEFKASLPVATEKPMEDIAVSDAQIVEEIVDKRTEYSKEFLLSNGLHMATVYPDAVHYETSSGWAEIDNTLKAKADGTYTNTAGVWNVRFPQQLNENKSVVIEKDGYTLSFAMAGELRSSGELMTAAMDTTIGALEQFSVSRAQNAAAAIQEIDKESIRENYQHPEAAPEKLYSRLQYTGVYQNTNVVYDLDSNRVKESIVMESYSSTLRGYKYTLNVGQLVPVLEEDGQITFYDKDKKNVVMVMPAPYLVDAAEEYSHEIEVRLTGKGSNYTLTYLLPTQWLADQQRSWPVILDPVVNANLSISNIKDDTVSEKNEYGYQKDILEAGHSDARGISRIYLMYQYLPTLTSSDVIVGAVIQMEKKYAGETVPLEVHKVNGTWQSSTLTWSNKPGYNSKVEDYAMVGEAKPYTWVITDIVRDWYTNQNSGMMFKVGDAEEAARDNRYKQFYSSDQGTVSKRPILAIYFRNNNGLESYWDYTTTSAGRAGTGYVNNYTGNLVWVRDDIGFGGNLMPVNISHVYNLNDAFVPNDGTNSNDSGGNSFGLGYGWRTNFNQLLYRWTISNYDSGSYIWEDADGTDHYFSLKDGKYQDEDDTELTLTDTGSGSNKYCITDKYGNSSYFDESGRLTKQTNNQQTPSNITVSYVGSSYQIDYITDGAGRVYDFAYTNNLLTGIHYKGTGSNDISYLTFGYYGQQLASVTDKDNKTCTYTYNDKGLLMEACNIDGITAIYTYNTPAQTWQPYRVNSVSLYDGGADGGRLTFAYGHNQTTLTDHNGNVEIHQFNDFGNTISIQDDEGHAAFAKYARNEKDDTAGKANQLTLSSKTQNTVSNAFRDSSFETGDYFTAIDSSVTAGRSNETAYQGVYASRMVRTTAGAESGVAGGAITVPAGQTYTFSAYVKTGTGSVHMVANDGSTVVLGDSLSANKDWTRLQVTYTNNSASAKSVKAQIMTQEAGVTFIDCVQGEQAETANRYNFIINGDFRASSSLYGWTKSSACTSSDVPVADIDPGAPQLLGKALRIFGSVTAQKNIMQTVKASGNNGDTFVLAGWAKADSVPMIGEDTRERKFCIEATFNYTDGSNKTFTANFNPCVGSDSRWQYTAEPMVAEKAYNSITVRVVYDYNANTAYFDGIQLYKEEFGSSYTYDEDGNVISVVDLQKQETKYEYVDNNLTEIIQNEDAKMTYVYDDYHNVTKATTQEGVVYNFTYDARGNNTSVSITHETKTITSTATYSADGNRLISTTDALGKVTTYGYNANTNVLEWVQYPEDTADTRTEYTYDSMYHTAAVACTTDSGAAMSATYTYGGDTLTQIQTPSTTYRFTYSAFNLMHRAYIDDLEIAEYFYAEDGNNYLTDIYYANGDRVHYAYDKKGRLTAQSYEDSEKVNYKYNNDGALAKVIDSETGITTTHYYDLTGRLMKYVESGDGYSHSVGYEYDTLNNLTQLVETVNGVEHTTTYIYDEDNRVEKVTSDGIEMQYRYDDFGRVWITGNGLTNQIFGYNSATETSTSAQVKKHFTGALTGWYKFFDYTYDDNGNITSVSDGTNTTTYVYDSANQLVRENNQAAGYTYTWIYDNAGNILRSRQFAYTTGEPTDQINSFRYDYEDANWGNMMSNFDGTRIIYDEVGNPLSDGTWTYTWKHGRELVSMSKGTETWTYTYNADGMRIGKTNGTITYSYVYNGSQLKQMTKGTDTLSFIYDAIGMPQAVNYNGTIYYYVTNLQGDVIAILDTSRAAVVEYMYNAWGELLSITGTMANTLGKLNPLRYRGYVYDNETELYYLQSRYYSPLMCRFINADAFVATGQGFIGNNMFAYCNNNPVMRYDPDGKLGLFTIGIIASAIIGGVASALSTAASGGSIGEVAASFAIGAVSGGAIAAASGLAAASAMTVGAAAAICSGIGVATEAISIGVEHAFHHDDPGYKFNCGKAVGRLIYAGGMGALSGSVSFGLSKIFIGGDALVGTCISAEASFTLSAMDFGFRQLMSAQTTGQLFNSRSFDNAPSRSTSVTGKVVSNPYGAAKTPNISTPSIIVRKPFYGHIR